ncbi:DUF975 family protein [Eubacteriales bacterium OttesenSCG-928-N13]|nr:DUF975 family protein [Eubacteriales bacterium OttesenSCG-928-N13]
MVKSIKNIKRQANENAGKFYWPAVATLVCYIMIPSLFNSLSILFGSDLTQTFFQNLQAGSVEMGPLLSALWGLMSVPRSAILVVIGQGISFVFQLYYVGICGQMIQLYQGEQPSTKMAFAAFPNQFSKKLLVVFKQRMLIFAWGLLVLVSIVLINVLTMWIPVTSDLFPGIAALFIFLSFVPSFIKAYAYSLTPYLLAEFPDIKSWDVIKTSILMTNGYKGKICVMQVRYGLTQLLGRLTFGLSQTFRTEPRMQAQLAGLYCELRDNAIKKRIVSRKTLEGTGE